MKMKIWALTLGLMVLLVGCLPGEAAKAKEQKLPMLKMLSSTTCPACDMMEPVLEELETQYKGKVTTDHINLDDHPEVAQAYHVRYVPMLIFSNAQGKEFAKRVGYMPLEDVLDVFAKGGVKLK
ncbi:MAG: thioredoxin family protein [Synergistaceae bacterium]|nr:thioredoxin family protein [Synergistaceae bacterium]